MTATVQQSLSVGIKNKSIAWVAIGKYNMLPCLQQLVQAEKKLDEWVVSSDPNDIRRVNKCVNGFHIEKSVNKTFHIQGTSN